MTNTSKFRYFGPNIFLSVSENEKKVNQCAEQHSKLRSKIRKKIELSIKKHQNLQSVKLRFFNKKGSNWFRKKRWLPTFF